MKTMTAQEYQDYINGKGTDNKKHKYKNNPVVTDEGYFPSKLEKERFDDLKFMQKNGLITGLMRQVTFHLKGVIYRADFVYYDISKKQFIVEDSKGMKTPEYKNKKKLMKNLLEIDILETR